MFRVSGCGKDDRAVLRRGVGQIVIVESPAQIREIERLQSQCQESSRRVGTEPCHQLASHHIDLPGLPDDRHRGEDIL